ncbi:Uma2 family endonuclease [Gloeobacter morelensis]|uniref:Uma2 family endonuclease n=1 Tax=Gloeobacter morelensis MG652769 TaxID=2781736 RepID=A0ABY3PL01_9CYAN|nr:Uma2 family endonuclease [Gloeobacter morelensis]UFP94340.1 Uma2 family endonuclease [Gloeobacter morelensis MG652769]
MSEEAIVQDDKPLAIDEHGEPVPDVTVVVPDPEGDYYSTRHPDPDDILLVVAVADSSFDKNLGTKKTMYTRAEIREYWILELNARRLHRFSEPRDGDFRNVEVLDENSRVSPVAFPALSVGFRICCPGKSRSSYIKNHALCNERKVRGLLPKSLTG